MNFFFFFSSTCTGAGINVKNAIAVRKSWTTQKKQFNEASRQTLISFFFLIFQNFHRVLFIHDRVLKESNKSNKEKKPKSRNKNPRSEDVCSIIRIFCGSLAEFQRCKIVEISQVHFIKLRIIYRQFFRTHIIEISMEF